MATTTATTPSGDLDGGGDTTQGGQGSHPFRTMPHNLEAEKGLLGAIFINNRAHETVSDFLRPEHFAYAQHGRIFEAAAKLCEPCSIDSSDLSTSTARSRPPPARAGVARR